MSVSPVYTTNIKCDASVWTYLSLCYDFSMDQCGEFRIQPGPKKCE